LLLLVTPEQVSGINHMNRPIVVLFALAVIVPAAFKSRPRVPYGAPAAFSVQSSGRTMVRIEGDVKHPGVYVFSANILATDVIGLAEPVRPLETYASGGAEKQLLRNGSAVHVAVDPNKSGTITVGSIPAAQCMILGIPLDINGMDADDLERLPGIGPQLAQRIVRFRHNNGGKLRPEDLLSVEGIGEKKYNVLKKHFN
jgi:competence protein ComEA